MTLKKKTKQRLIHVLVALVLFFGVSNAWYQFKQYSSLLKTEMVTDVSQQEFINSIAPTAQQVASENDLYASVMIAQAVLESQSGQSELSQAPYYNFFGIKGDYYGHSIEMLTNEDDGTGNVYQVLAAFRSYDSVEASLKDYAELLSQDIYLGVHKSQTASYQEATQALTGVYATDTNYNTKLNALIELYQLTTYDN